MTDDNKVKKSVKKVASNAWEQFTTRLSLVLLITATLRLIYLEAQNQPFMYMVGVIAVYFTAEKVFKHIK